MHGVRCAAPRQFERYLQLKGAQLTDYFEISVAGRACPARAQVFVGARRGRVDILWGKSSCRGGFHFGL